MLGFTSKWLKHGGDRGQVIGRFQVPGRPEFVAEECGDGRVRKIFCLLAERHPLLGDMLPLVAVDVFTELLSGFGGSVVFVLPVLVEVAAQKLAEGRESCGGNIGCAARLSGIAIVFGRHKLSIFPLSTFRIGGEYVVFAGTEPAQNNFGVGTRLRGGRAAMEGTTNWLIAVIVEDKVRMPASACHPFFYARLALLEGISDGSFRSGFVGVSRGRGDVLVGEALAQFLVGSAHMFTESVAARAFVFGEIAGNGVRSARNAINAGVGSSEGGRTFAADP